MTFARMACRPLRFTMVIPAGLPFSLTNNSAGKLPSTEYFFEENFIKSPLTLRGVVWRLLSNIHCEISVCGFHHLQARILIARYRNQDKA